MARRYTRLSADQWTAIINQYGTGTITIPELADRWEVSTSSITQKVRAAGKTRLPTFKPSVAIAAAATAVAGIKLDPVAPPSNRKPTAAEIEQRVIETNAAALSSAVAIQRMVDVCLAAMTVPTSSQEAGATARVLAQITEVAAQVNKIRRTALRMDRENSNTDVILPELPITIMTPEEVAAIRAEQARDDARPLGSTVDALDLLDLEDHAADQDEEVHVEGCEAD